MDCGVSVYNPDIIWTEPYKTIYQLLRHKHYSTSEIKLHLSKRYPTIAPFNEVDDGHAPINRIIQCIATMYNCGVISYIYEDNILKWRQNK